MKLSHNLPSLNVYSSQIKSEGLRSKALDRISSGYKINSARDGANEIAQSETMRMQIRSLDMAARNVQDGVSMLQATEGSLGNITDILQRMRELVVSSDDTKTQFDKKVIQDELDQLKLGINELVKGNDFNGVNIINNTTGETLAMPSGSNPSDKIDIPTFNLNTNNLKDSAGNFVSGIDLTAGTTTNSALKTLDEAITHVSNVSSQFGAIENRFDTAYSDLNEMSDRVTGTESLIRDADLAEEMLNYSKSDLLVNAGLAMIVQTNKMPQEILQVLSNLRSR